MILGFKKQFPPLISAGIKIHTIREDKHNRWKKGNKIHFATGVRTKDYNQFKNTGVCYSTQAITIRYPTEYFNDVRIRIDGILMSVAETQRIAHNDGFENLAAFLIWFNSDFDGKIIHWTKLKY
jgi:hypothetical protein